MHRKKGLETAILDKETEWAPLSGQRAGKKQGEEDEDEVLRVDESDLNIDDDHLELDDDAAAEEGGDILFATMKDEDDDSDDDDDE
ncbi:MAG: hypothetical protein Q9227_004628 [Pyrenula ochraceoflavens]